jgi:hypothetical protein
MVYAQKRIQMVTEDVDEGGMVVGFARDGQKTRMSFKELLH